LVPSYHRRHHDRYHFHYCHHHSLTPTHSHPFSNLRERDSGTKRMASPTMAGTTSSTPSDQPRRTNRPSLSTAGSSPPPTPRRPSSSRRGDTVASSARLWASQPQLQTACRRWARARISRRSESRVSMTPFSPSCKGSWPRLTTRLGVTGLAFSTTTARRGAPILRAGALFSYVALLPQTPPLIRIS
jgi:hypothetical protein